MAEAALEVAMLLVCWLFSAMAALADNPERSKYRKRKASNGNLEFKRESFYRHAAAGNPLSIIGDGLS